MPSKIVDTQNREDQMFRRSTFLYSMYTYCQQSGFKNLPIKTFIP